MGAETKIEWCDYTFNPWIGCSHAMYMDSDGKKHVHQGCLRCYAEADMDLRRHRVKWGLQGTRSRTSDAYWNQPIKWNRDAQRAGERRRVFCASLADVFENWQGPIVDAKSERLWHMYPPSKTYTTDTDGHSDKIPLTMDELRSDLFAIIDQTSNLDWLLLTKRPDNIRKMWPGRRRNNVYLGTSISEQASANAAIPHILACRDLSPVLFLSAEPLLGPVDLINITVPRSYGTYLLNSLTGAGLTHHGEPFNQEEGKISWVIIGGESGTDARSCDVKWIRDIIRQGRESQTKIFVKQRGSNSVSDDPDEQLACTLSLRLDRKGAWFSDSLKDLFVREYPQ